MYTCNKTLPNYPSYRYEGKAYSFERKATQNAANPFSKASVRNLLAEIRALSRIRSLSSSGSTSAACSVVPKIAEYSSVV